MLADFTNTTSDSVFDGTLRQGLAVQLEQSPYLNLVSEQQIAQTLKQMEQPLGARLTNELARDVCQRVNATAAIEGSVAMIDNQYIVGLSAVNCRKGEVLAREQVTSENMKSVLAALAKAASELRAKLGESLASVMLNYEALTAAYSGELAKARDFARRAAALAEHTQERETAASYRADEAVGEALFGNNEECKKNAAAALEESKGRDVQAAVALAYAFAGDAARAQALANDLSKRFPEDTIAQFNYVPEIRAQISLEQGDAGKAIEFLQATSPYELGAPNPIVPLALYPVYVRGEAYLASRNGSAAAAEFQKVLDHRGAVQNEPVGALAHLQLGRAYALQGDTAKARIAYQDFLTLWKDADADVPILKQAKTEYAKLQ